MDGVYDIYLKKKTGFENKIHQKYILFLNVLLYLKTKYLKKKKNNFKLINITRV